MKQKLLIQTQDLIETIPQDKLKAVYLFVSWLVDERLSQKELELIIAGEKEIKKGLSVLWRGIARTI